MVLLFSLLSGDASGAEANGADLLNVARRAAVIDQLMVDHLERARATVPFGGLPRARFSSNASFYQIPELQLTDGGETFPVELARTYTGFVFDLLPKEAGEYTSEAEPVLYLVGGGLAYGLDRPFRLPSPVPDDEDPWDDYGDPTGLQYTDAQYALGGRHGLWRAELAWQRSRVVEAESDGIVNGDDLTDRLNRGQARLAGPFGLSSHLRVAPGVGVEEAGVQLGVTDAIEQARRRPDPEQRAPHLALSWREANYGASQRDRPTIAGFRLDQSLGWLFGPFTSDAPRRWEAGLSLGADADLVAKQAQLGLATGDLRGRFEWWAFAFHAGASLYQDAALQPLTGRPTAVGQRAGFELSFPWLVSCPKKRGEACRFLAPSAIRLGGDYSASWAEDLRYLVEYAGHPNSFVYMEIMGGHR